MFTEEELLVQQTFVFKVSNQLPEKSYLGGFFPVDWMLGFGIPNSWKHPQKLLMFLFVDWTCSPVASVNPLLQAIEMWGCPFLHPLRYGWKKQGPVKMG